MPYIKPQERYTAEYDPATPGDLNYAFTVLALRYLERRGKSYDSLNAIIGAFEAAKLEFVRRVVIPYEDQKKADNGDVYG